MEQTIKTISEMLLIDNETYFNLHHVAIDDNCKGGWYCQMRSYGAFLQGGVLTNWHKNIYKKGKPELMIYGAWFDSMHKINDLVKEEFHHDNLWDFYKHIGYDHKKKNYKVLYKDFRRVINK